METSFAIFQETEVPENELIISRTDLSGIITYVNDTFAEISGYDNDELIGQSHNILRHPDMPHSVFKTLWDTIEAGNSWEGYVKNRRKDNGYYWVYANISGVYKDGKLVEYKSLRSFVPKAKRDEVQKVYDELRQNEGDTVRTVTYLPADLYTSLKLEASDSGQSIDDLVIAKLSK
ncbi:MAG: PAS domain-containing protein [Campylobacterota bacterium]|nr:PAS domain-containing protein [Campylobacterota bacterium]